MLGFENMIRDLIVDQLGMTPEELREQLQASVNQARLTIEAITNNQRILYHQNIRIIKLLEHIAGADGVALVEESLNEAAPVLALRKDN